MAETRGKMGRILKPEAKPVFTIEVWPWKDRIIGHCTCGRCGEKFSVTLWGHPEAIAQMCGSVEAEKFLRQRLFNVANRKHYCDEDSLKKDPAETNRIINKWHETKRKLLRVGKQEPILGKDPDIE